MCFNFYSMKAEVHQVNTGMYYFAPATLSVNVGDTVVWYNDGGYHDVNAVSNSITGQSFNNPQPLVQQPLALKAQLFTRKSLVQLEYIVMIVRLVLMHKMV